jgi:hypothetical protein
LRVPDFEVPLLELSVDPSPALAMMADGGGDVSLALSSKAEDGIIRETFFADTGANRHIHHNANAAASFYRMELDIGTAQGSGKMKSEGVGTMLLRTADGVPMPGFNRVVFSKQAAAKLASVGDICDANMVTADFQG